MASSLGGGPMLRYLRKLGAQGGWDYLNDGIRSAWMKKKIKGPLSSSTMMLMVVVMTIGSES